MEKITLNVRFDYEDKCTKLINKTVKTAKTWKVQNDFRVVSSAVLQNAVSFALQFFANLAATKPSRQTDANNV